ncbi:ABC transporter ATP-binding protein [Wenxinia marina]|uniref:Carbohydrate ABC transporter ATP-binding protein, CUT1 family n=1 Tax=Wenxinia marina DSM 24838 TaxID=1123501 RepID=A0A0D0Q7K6_9RHOB|nr:sn-glycerol-3-phosphate ABC transporter ATP-binding protein UgpC [Wenxinia marina]KIQ70439.1 carbohydrate ABC transporter ATP-binding protein, CUT1 family [Wenxinia marina DSM 24838]GGL53141.1 ABC transporter ATP-binding protein [Wenxinia marina]
MAEIVLDRVSKSFGSVSVIDNVSLEVAEREFVVFLGPSGSGKSTLLRMIAGLESIDSGTLTIGGKRCEHLPPGQRGVAMVFQNYALYPHMSVRENMAFGLRNVGIERGEIDRRVAEAGRVLEMEELLDRKPAQLSGGQRQRVAIGRAIVKEPQAFLFDEPLSNLDAALRVRTRVELARLHQRIAATMIYVTHDQTEAMTLADRIVVLNDRRIEQVGRPMDVYNRPASRFVAGFVGSPGMNILPAMIEEGGVKLADGGRLAVPHGSAPRSISEFGIRPEAVEVVSPEGADVVAEAEVVERLGERTLVYCRLEGGGRLIAQTGGDTELRAGDRVGLRFDTIGAHVFDTEGRAFHLGEAA